MLPLFISAIENDDDRQFVADIYTRYQPALYRKAQKVLHDNDRAEEAVHEAMLRVIRYLDRVREIPSDELLPYLITIVQTTSISIYNKYKQHRETVFGTAEDWAACLSDNGSCIDDILIREDRDDILIREDRIELLKMCLKQLTQREIDILNYFYTLDLPQKEIAGLTGLTTGNVRLIISRAKKKVLAAYDERGGFDYE